MRALVTASFHADSLARLRKLMDVVHEDWRQTHVIHFSDEDFAKKVREVGADVLIVEADLVHEEVVTSCGLQMIGAARGDPVNIRVDLATEKKIPVFFAPARNAQAVAELTIGFMLSVMRRIHSVYHALKTGKLVFEGAGDFMAAYEGFAGVELEGKTVGIVGFGAIGQRVARILKGFGSRVIAYDPYADDGMFESLGAERMELDPLIRECDVLTIHCPQAPETFDLVNAERVKALKKGAFVMNLARASILNEDALYDALASGHLAGAGLDVFTQEPVRPDNRFLALPNVVAMPHFGGNTRETAIRQSEMIVDAIEAHLAGNTPPKHTVNPEVYG